MLLLTLSILAGCIGDSTRQTPAAPPGQQPAGSDQDPSKGTMNLTVYFATKDAMYLVPEVRTVPKNDQPARTALEQLFTEPRNKELVRVMPPGTKLKNLVIKDQIAYVDFSEHIIKNNPGGSATEVLLVSSIVNTLTEFPQIQKVQILVEGNKVATLNGHLDVSEPLSRSEKIIKKL